MYIPCGCYGRHVVAMGDMFLIPCSRNVNRAHGDPLNQTFAVQTPPVGIRVNVEEVSCRPCPTVMDLLGQSLPFLVQVQAFPGEEFEMGIFATDELNVPTTSVVGFLDDSTTSLSGDTKVEGRGIAPISA